MATYDITSQTPSKLVAGDILNCSYSRVSKSITLPPGIYKLECWGAYAPYSTGNWTSSHTYGYGGYATGTVTLNSERTLHIYVGGTPTSSYVTGSFFHGGWNGGGGKTGSYGDNAPGGGATDICLTSSDVTLDSYYRYIRTSASYLSRIIVAGGGGGGRTNNASCQGGYCPAGTMSTGYHGSMTSAGDAGSSYYNSGSFGYGASATYTGDDRGAGGGGWYGGGGAGDSYGGGGSSFVWCDQYASYIPSGYTPTNDLKMTNVSVLLGSSNNCPAGVTSNGYARITIIEISRGLNLSPKINAIYYEGESYVKVDGTWYQAEEGWVKVNGVWQSIS